MELGKNQWYPLTAQYNSMCFLLEKHNILFHVLGGKKKERKKKKSGQNLNLISPLDLTTICRKYKGLETCQIRLHE